MGNTKADVLIPSDAEFEALYRNAYRIWHGHWTRAVSTNLKRPPLCLDTTRLFPHHPAIPVDLELDQAGNGHAKSTWSSFGCDISSFHRQWDFQLVGRQGMTAILSDKANEAASSWFGEQAGHVAILSLAWTYALSARWAKLVSQANPLEYTSSQASWATEKPSDTHPDDNTRTVLQLGHVNNDEARWWSAILSPGQGWIASYANPRGSLRSPWSITLDTSTISITLSSPDYHSPPSTSPAASFASALRYIQSYCAFHNCFKESRAALAATLMFPLSAIDRRKIRLYVPRGAFSSPISNTRSRPSPPPIEKHHVEELDRLLTLSTNWLGLKAILGSVFYQQGIFSNTCGAWLQGTFAVLDGKQALTNTPVLAQMLFDRGPNVAFLWLGAILTGAHHEFLRKPDSLMHMNYIQLHAAYWTNTITSFIQEPAHLVAVKSKSISRANECRLMYIAQEPPRDHPPFLPYPPLGETAIKDADLGVQIHAHCREPHQLRFVSLTWRCRGGRKVTFTADPKSVLIPNKSFLDDQHNTKFEIDYSFMDREGDSSEGATRNIFMWMRNMDGYTENEREIREHEWVATFSDDDDEEDAPPDDDGGSDRGVETSVRVGRWLAKSYTDRYNSL